MTTEKKPPYKIHGFVVLTKERDFGPEEVILRACKKMVAAIEGQRAEAYQVSGNLGVPRDKTVAITLLDEETAWLMHQGSHLIAALPEGKALVCPHCNMALNSPRCPECAALGQMRDAPSGDGWLNTAEPPDETDPESDLG